MISKNREIGLFIDKRIMIIVQNKEKMHFIPHMLAYVGIFL